MLMLQTDLIGPFTLLNSIHHFRYFFEAIDEKNCGFQRAHCCACIAVMAIVYTISMTSAPLLGGCDEYLFFHGHSFQKV